jgi:hypothetical protein
LVLDLPIVKANVYKSRITDLAGNHQPSWVRRFQPDRRAQAQRTSDTVGDDILQRLSGERLDGKAEDAKGVVRIGGCIACRPDIFAEECAIEKV